MGAFVSTHFRNYTGCFGIKSRIFNSWKQQRALNNLLSSRGRDLDEFRALVAEAEEEWTIMSDDVLNELKSLLDDFHTETARLEAELMARQNELMARQARAREQAEISRKEVLRLTRRLENIQNELKVSKAKEVHHSIRDARVETMDLIIAAATIMTQESESIDDQVGPLVECMNAIKSVFFDAEDSCEAGRLLFNEQWDKFRNIAHELGATQPQNEFNELIGLLGDHRARTTTAATE